MSEQEKKSGGGVEGSSVVLVEQSAASRHKQPFRPTELQEEAQDLHNKRSRAPAVPSSVAENLKDNANSETKDRRECERTVSSEKQKHSTPKKLSVTSKRRGSSPETITMAQLEIDTKKSMVTPAPQPIPAQVSAVASTASDLNAEKFAAERVEEDDSITDEIAELRTPDVTKKASEWSDEEEAGGLPRSESRASRVSRAVRQLLCCGVRVEAPSEHDLSPRPDEGI